MLAKQTLHCLSQASSFLWLNSVLVALTQKTPTCCVPDVIPALWKSLLDRENCMCKGPGVESEKEWNQECAPR
jgi:hypothetical protein